MQVISADIPDVKIIEPRLFSDSRGFFYESYNHNALQDALKIDLNFVQDNHPLERSDSSDKVAH